MADGGGFPVVYPMSPSARMYERYERFIAALERDRDEPDRRFARLGDPDE